MPTSTFTQAASPAHGYAVRLMRCPGARGSCTRPQSTQHLVLPTPSRLPARPPARPRNWQPYGPHQRQSNKGRMQKPVRQATPPGPTTSGAANPHGRPSPRAHTCECRPCSTPPVARGPPRAPGPSRGMGRHTHLHVVGEPGWEQRPDGPIDNPRPQGVLVRHAAHTVGNASHEETRARTRAGSRVRGWERQRRGPSVAGATLHRLPLPAVGR
jgi:hypothetical protein